MQDPGDETEERSPMRRVKPASAAGRAMKACGAGELTRLEDGLHDMSEEALQRQLLFWRVRRWGVRGLTDAQRNEITAGDT